MMDFDLFLKRIEQGELDPEPEATYDKRCKSFFHAAIGVLTKDEHTILVLHDLKRRGLSGIDELLKNIAGLSADS
jgi:hypothetical protein